MFHRFRITSVLFIFALYAFVSFVSFVSADTTNKAGLLARIDTITTSATTNIATQKQLLLDRASALGDLYDTRLRTAGFTSEDVAGLMRIGALAYTGSFRDAVSRDYIALDATLFADAKTSLAALASLRLDISLGTSDVTDGQRVVYSGSVDTLERALLSTESGTIVRIDTFADGERKNLDARLRDIQQAALAHATELAGFRAVRGSYGDIETGLAELNHLVTDIDNNVLQALQNNLILLDTQKVAYRKQLADNLSGALSIAVTKSPRIGEKKEDVLAFIDILLREWDSTMENDFSDDQHLLLAFTKAQNIMRFERDLRSRIYDASGSIDYAATSVSGGLATTIGTLHADIHESTGALAGLLLRYANEKAVAGSTVVSSRLETRLQDTYLATKTDTETRLRQYFDRLLAHASLSETNALLQQKGEKLSDAAKSLLTQRNTLVQERALLSKEKNALDRAHEASVLASLTLEKRTFDASLRKGLSLSYAKKRVKAFLQTVKVLASGGSNRIQALAERLRYAALAKLYERTLIASYATDHLGDDKQIAALDIATLQKSGSTVEEARVLLRTRFSDNTTALTKASKKQVYRLLLEQREICLRLAKK